MGLSTISRAKRDQTWREDVVTNGIGRVEGIAVDWIAGEPRRVQAACEAEDGEVGSWKEGSEEKGQAGTDGGAAGAPGLGGAPVCMLPPHPLSIYPFLRQHLLDGPGL